MHTTAIGRQIQDMSPRSEGPSSERDGNHELELGGGELGSDARGRERRDEEQLALLLIRYRAEPGRGSTVRSRLRGRELAAARPSLRHLGDRNGEGGTNQGGRGGSPKAGRNREDPRIRRRRRTGRWLLDAGS